MLRKALTGILLIAALSLPAWTQGAVAQEMDPGKKALIEEMMRVTHPDQMIAQFLQQYKAAFTKGLEDAYRNEVAKGTNDPAKYRPALDKLESQMFALISDRMSWERLKPKFMVIYDQTFSKEELSDIVAFYKTPSGQSLLQKMPALMAKGSQVGQEQMSGAVPEVQKMTADFLNEIKEAQKKP